AGPAYVTPMLLAAAAGLVGSALWAQYLEGSPVLLRPYGFYGGVLGIVAAAIAVTLARAQDPWPLLGADSVAAPWVQAVGLRRCLVQGCCHGRPAPEAIGIRYTHPRSRVCKAELAGVPLHATPLYSIGWNVVVGVVLARMWALGAPLHLVGGVYLVLGGI